ncbi:MAG: GlsB/YeaQ/YmgE family stress response membrane protein [Solirubrobacterales bacterium]
MSDHRHIPEPGELVHAPQPSWAPIFFAIGAIGLVCGIYAGGFIFAPFVYAIIGAILVLAAFRSVVRGAIRDYFRLPRKQKVRGAALPIEAISAPPRRS